MKHLNRIPSQFSISIPEDENGMIGRECPESTCEGYFKIQLGTGLKGENLPCHCPYCGHNAGQDKFFTKAQIEYIESVALNKVSDALLKDLKSMEFDHKPQGGFGIGISMKVSGRATPIRYYREENLETEVVCDKCTLRYMIYGVFGFCPDCSIHNSLQILEKNFELIEKLVTLAKTQDASVSQQLTASKTRLRIVSQPSMASEGKRVGFMPQKRQIPERLQTFASRISKEPSRMCLDSSALISPQP